MEEKKQKNQGWWFLAFITIIDKGFKEMMEKLVSYDTYGMKEYKEVFVVDYSFFETYKIVVERKIGCKWMEISYSRSRQDGKRFPYF